MKKIIAAHQPNFLPWLGLFYKIYKCDEFIWADNVQFSTRNGINTHRNCIKTSQGVQDIRIPVKKNSTDKICEVEIDYCRNWIPKMKKTMFLNYGKAKFYEEVSDWFFEILDYKYEIISELNKRLIEDICNRMGFGITFDSCSKYNISGKKEEYVINLVKFFDGNVYYSGTGAADYLHYDTLKKEGIDLIYSDYKTVSYPQLWGKFIGDLSIIDYLFNCGFTNPFEIQEMD